MCKTKVIANDVMREIVEQAHMAGQRDAGVDPSYSNARNYYDGLFVDGIDFEQGSRRESNE